MKIFLSWSGEQSRKVAEVFRDWFPSVIQSLVPYVSSEDIDKGARWSTDIATELANSTFGILCVTKENINAPWLNFEAGALSKTIDKSFVSPFLFNIHRSEINAETNGPILQFQSTIFEKEDIKKLLKTVNKACGDEKLPDDRLEIAFDVWYPKLEEKLNEILLEKTNEAENKQNKKTPPDEILEEILEISRLNQKLLRSPGVKYPKEIEQQINMLIKERLSFNRMEEEDYINKKRKKFNPMIIEELLHYSSHFGNNYIGLQLVFSLFRNDYPWLYDAGLELVRVLRDKKENETEKEEAVRFFEELVEFTLEHPIIREVYSGDNRELHMILRMLRHNLIRAVESSI